ncbi:MAG TPA: hypothetical protein VLX68_04440 [Chitinivibrionales bacterium]|nr:hypothetical protein [Chitinivibrionales bacterium]
MIKKAVIALVCGVLFLNCAVGFVGRRGHVVIVPALPEIVEVDPDGYYYQGDYVYWYNGGVWFYARSRGGPWIRLPRERYPHDTHFRHHEEHHEER